jgi:hypothetical protein
MKSAVIAKPNIKLFLCGALLVAAVGHFTGNGQSQSRTVVQARTVPGQLGSDEYLRQLLEEAAQNVTPELCMQISAAYEQRGDPKRALSFLRLADRLEESELNR